MLTNVSFLNCLRTWYQKLMCCDTFLFLHFLSQFQVASNILCWR